MRGAQILVNSLGSMINPHQESFCSSGKLCKPKLAKNNATNTSV